MGLTVCHRLWGRSSMKKQLIKRLLSFFWFTQLQEHSKHLNEDIQLEANNTRPIRVVPPRGVLTGWKWRYTNGSWKQGQKYDYPKRIKRTGDGPLRRMSSYDSGKKMGETKGQQERNDEQRRKKDKRKGLGQKPMAADASRKRRETRVFKETELL